MKCTRDIYVLRLFIDAHFEKGLTIAGFVSSCPQHHVVGSECRQLVDIRDQRIIKYNDAARCD